MRIHETSIISEKLNLVDLIRGNSKSIDSDEWDPSWKCTDYTKGHLLVMVVTMAITYVFQLAGFISYIIKFSPNTIQNHKEIILIQPYFECIQRFLILFLNKQLNKIKYMHTTKHILFLYGLIKI